MNKRRKSAPSLRDSALEQRFVLSAAVAANVPTIVEAGRSVFQASGESARHAAQAEARTVDVSPHGRLGIVYTNHVFRHASEIRSQINLMTGQFSGSTNARIDRPTRAILQLNGTGTIGDGRTTYSMSVSGSVTASITTGGRLGDVIDGRLTLSNSQGSLTLNVQRYRYEIVGSSGSFAGTRGRGGLSLYVNLNNFQGPFNLNLKGDVIN